MSFRFREKRRGKSSPVSIDTEGRWPVKGLRPYPGIDFSKPSMS